MSVTRKIKKLIEMPVNKLLLLVLICKISGSSMQKPHIVFIIADDMGFNDVSFHGSNQIPTPNIDALAYGGVIMNNHYSQPYCTPSRAALLTGKHPIQLGLQGVPLFGAELGGLPLNEKLLPQYLKESGYSTHLVGKWHLGFSKNEYTPLERGFDSHLGYYNGVTSYYDHVYEDVGNLTYSGYDMRRNKSVAWDLVGKYSTDIFTEAAISTIRSQLLDKPMFLMVTHTAVHSGNKGKYLEAPQGEIEKFSYITNPNRRMYAAMASKLDQSVGDIVDALNKKNMLKNSVVVFISDNGSPNSPGVMFNNWGSNNPFRGQKGGVWEGGVRVPAVIWSPLIQSPSRVETNLFHISDWLPTLLNIAGYKAFDYDSNIYGIDQWDTVSKGLQSQRNELIVNIDEVSNISAVVYREFKYIEGASMANEDGFLNLYTVNESSPAYRLETLFQSKTWKAIAKFNKFPLKWCDILKLRESSNVKCKSSTGLPDCNRIPCLFNLHADPCEQINLANTLPDIAKLLKMKLTAFRQALLVPQRNITFCTRSDPKCFNNTWSSWL